MKKIDITLIKKYVNGEDLGEYSIEQLENDKDFMIGVIGYTKDIKMYSFCSEEVKKDYELVKYLVFKFKDNTNFITTVADYFLENTDTDWERIELGIIMEKVLPQNLSDKYRVMNETAYFTERLQIEVAEVEEPELETMIGMGFWLIFDQYNGSDIILDYYANLLLREIIRDNNIDFEKMLHTQFKSADKITELGINNYIVSFVGYYDSMLSSYITTHLDLVKPIANEIKNIQDNWDTYSSKDEAKIYNNMLDMVHEYMFMTDSNMSEKEILYYVAKELEIDEKVKKYDGINDLENELDIELDYDEEVLNDMIKSEIKRNLKERITYLTIKKIIMNQLFSDNPLDLNSLIGDDDNQSTGGSKCKIINLNPDDKK